MTFKSPSARVARAAIWMTLLAAPIMAAPPAAADDPTICDRLPAAGGLRAICEGILECNGSGCALYPVSFYVDVHLTTNFDFRYTDFVHGVLHVAHGEMDSAPAATLEFCISMWAGYLCP